jgi:hypothetical protein
MANGVIRPLTKEGADIYVGPMYETAGLFEYSCSHFFGLKAWSAGMGSKWEEGWMSDRCRCHIPGPTAVNHPSPLYVAWVHQPKSVPVCLFYPVGHFCTHHRDRHLSVLRLRLKHRGSR